MEIKPPSYITSNSTNSANSLAGINRDSSRGNQFLGKLEKHLDDVKHNKGYLSKTISQQVQAKQVETSLELGTKDIRALSNYQAYASALSYNNKARFIHNVNEATKNLKILNNKVG
jgi:hypothetical protein